jgi:sugar lactone lactonase YvrE
LLVAGLSVGVVFAVRYDRLALEVAAGRYVDTLATGALARFRARSFGAIGGVAYDESRSAFYLSETSAHRLHRVAIVDVNDVETWTITLLSGAPDDDATGDFVDGAFADARYDAPTGMWFSAADDALYVADGGNHCVRALDLTAQTVATLAGTCRAFGHGEGVAARDAGLFAPRAITGSPNGDLFIADSGNQRVVRVARGDGSDVVTTVLGDGTVSSSGEGAPSRIFPVANPLALATNARGDLFLTSSTVVRLLPANNAGVVDGAGDVLTIYGRAPRDTFPEERTQCLSGLAVPDDSHVRVVDACAGFLVELTRTVAP